MVRLQRARLVWFDELGPVLPQMLLSGLGDMKTVFFVSPSYFILSDGILLLSGALNAVS